MFSCTNHQCGITSDELQHKCPHAVSMNSSRNKQAITTTKSTDLPPVAATAAGIKEDDDDDDDDDERSIVEHLAENEN